MNNSIKIYGVIDNNGCNIDVSKSLHGAKMIATKHGYKTIAIRYSNTYQATIILRRVNNKWIKEEVTT